MRATRARVVAVALLALCMGGLLVWWRTRAPAAGPPTPVPPPQTATPGLVSEPLPQWWGRPDGQRMRVTAVPAEVTQALALCAPGGFLAAAESGRSVPGGAARERIVWSQSGRSSVAEFVWQPVEPPSRAETDADSTGVAKIVFTDSFVAGCDAWRYAKAVVRRAPADEVYVSPGCAAVCSFSGALAPGAGVDPCALQGSLVRTPDQLIIIGQVAGSSSPPDLQRLAPAAAIRWPPGMGGVGRTTESTLAAGTVWTHEWPDGGPLSRDPEARGEYWPLTLRSWSDGRVWAMSVAVGYSERGEARRWQIKPCCGTVGPPPDFLSAPASGQHGSALALKRWSDTSRTLGYGSPDLPAYRRAAKIVQAHAGPVAREARLRLLGEDDLARLTDEPVPDRVRDLWDAGRLSVCPAMELKGDAVLGDATVGIAAIGDPEDPYSHLDAPGHVSGAVQWVQTRNFVALTWLGDANRFDGGSSYLSPLTYDLLPRLDRDHLERECKWRGETVLRALPLEAQRWFDLLPQKWEKRPEGYWWTLKLLPDTEVGLLRKIRVGDTPWGRATIWSDPGVGHIVFDLRDPSP